MGLGYLALADGATWRGIPFGALGRRTGEVVFNTGMTGYQEVLTDPSYNRQIVVMTAPQIGNTGINPEDDESGRMWVAGFVVRAASRGASSWRSTGTLDEALAAMAVPGLSGVDCRAVVGHIRDHGAMPGAIVTDGGSRDDARRLAASAPDINDLDLVGEVMCAAAYEWNEDAGDQRYAPSKDDPAAWAAPAPTSAAAAAGPAPVPTSAAAAAGPAPSGAGRLHVVVYDFGVKRNILRLLGRRGCRVTVVPGRTAASSALALDPDAILLSNGPGDPAALGDVIDIAAALLGNVPVLGVCLGHQLLGLALGGRTYKLKFGHRGANQPVQGPDGMVAISSHNHGFALAKDPWPPGAGVEITRINLNDGCVEGLAAPERMAYGVQYHPEAAPGPHDAVGIFDDFLARAAARKGVPWPGG